jgi:hypothetical protein
MAVFTYPFDVPGNYTYDSNKIVVSGGLAELAEDRSDIYARWHLNESTGTNVPDDSGNVRDGTTVNMDDTNWVSGKLNNCLLFNGTNEFVNCGAIGGFEYNVPWSMEFWFRTVASGVTDMILSKRDSGGNATGWDIRHANGYIYVYLRYKLANYIAIRCNIAGLNDDSWHHCVITYDGSGVAAGILPYIDNVLGTKTVTSDTLGGNTILNTANFNIGALNSTANYYGGYLDEVVVYDRVITASEVAYRWNGGAGTEKFPKWRTDSPTIYKTAGDYDATLYDFTNFSETSSPAHAGTLAYQLSDDGINWKYWNGAAWVAAGASNYNSATTVNTNIGSFPAGAQKIYVQSFFISDGTQDVGLDLLQIGWTANAPPFVDAGTNKTCYDHESISPFSNCSFSDPDGTVDYARYKVDGEVDVWTNIPQGGYGTLLEAVQAFQYTFDNPGVVTVRLQVEDNIGATSEDSLTVTVNKYDVTFNVRDKDTGGHIANLTFNPGDGSGDQSVSSPFVWYYDWNASDRLISISATGYFPILDVAVPTTVHTENFDMVTTSFFRGFVGINWDRTNSKLIVNSWLESQGRVIDSGLAYMEIKIETCDSGGSITTLATKDTTTFNARGIAEFEFTSAELGGDLSADELYVVTGTVTYLASIYTFVFAFSVEHVDTADSVKKIERILFNRFRVYNNQGILYADDGVTPLYTWDLKDILGNPTSVQPFERVPI